MSSSTETSFDEDQTEFSSHKGPPSDLKHNQKMWLVIGICLHDILSPVLRKYIEPEMNQLYTSLVASNHINAQLYDGYLQSFPTGGNGYYLNYETINNNKASYETQKKRYEYKVQNAVDFSKLFLQPNVAVYTAFDESCDSSALLGILINVNVFPASVRNYANTMRSNIRNPWSHCDFPQWDTGKYVNSIQLMVKLVQNLGLISSEEDRIIGVLNKWETTGINFLSGTTIGLELVTEMRHKTIILSKHIEKMAKHAQKTDSYILEILNVVKALKDTMDTDDGKMLKLEEDIKKVENKTDIYSEMLGETVKGLQADDEELRHRVMRVEYQNRLLLEEISRRDYETIPRHIKAQHDEYIQEWKRDGETFVVTRATQHVYDSLELVNCVVVTGESGSGKSAIIHFVALQLKEHNSFEIIPFVTGPQAIIHYFNPKRNQVFVIDDICGEDSINIETVQLWKDYNDQLEQILKADDDKSGGNTFTQNEFNRTILLISCRNHIYQNSHFQTVKFLTKFECSLLSYELCLLPTEKELIQKRYISGDMIDSLQNLRYDSDLFPLLCQLSKGKDRRELGKLFSSPEDYIKNDINRIISSDSNMQSCAFVLCILFNNSFNVEWLDDEEISYGVREKIRTIIKVFHIDLYQERRLYYLIDAFNTLENTYFKRRGTQYRLIHDKIYEIAAVICGNRFKDIFIKYTSSTFIRDHYRFESLNTANDHHHIILSEDKEDIYFQRLIDDLKDQDVKSTLNNKQLEFKLFRTKLIAHLRRNIQEERRSFLNKLLQCFKPNIRNVKDLLMYIEKEGIRYKTDCLETTPLVEAASTGFLDIAKFLIEIKCSVNKADMIGRSPLYKACEKGHLNVVKLLLKNSAYMSNLPYMESRHCLSLVKKDIQMLSNSFF